MFFANKTPLYPVEGFNIIDALIVAFIAILIVFLVLVVIIAVASLFSKIIKEIDYRKNINPRPENSLLNEDEDAVVAVMVATIDYHRENKVDARLVKITRIEED